MCMDSVLYQLFSGHFQTTDWERHRSETVSLRLQEYRRRFSAVLEETEEPLKIRWLEIMETLVKDQLEEQPDMFCLGFTLGAKMMIEVLTFS